MDERTTARHAVGLEPERVALSCWEERLPVRAKVLVNSCIDFRFVDPLIEWLRALGLRGQYDLRTHEGCALTVDEWRQSDAAIDRLHDVEAVWIVDHEDCGAYNLRGAS